MQFCSQLCKLPPTHINNSISNKLPNARHMQGDWFCFDCKPKKEASGTKHNPVKEESRPEEAGITEFPADARHPATPAEVAAGRQKRRGSR